MKKALKDVEIKMRQEKKGRGYKRRNRKKEKMTKEEGLKDFGINRKNSF